MPTKEKDNKWQIPTNHSLQHGLEGLRVLHNDIISVIEQAQQVAFRSVNLLLIKRNWLLGKRIFSDNFNHVERAAYGKQVVKELSAMLSVTYGESFSETNLYHCIDFARTFPNIFYIDKQKSHTLCGEYTENIFHTLCGESDIYDLLNSPTPITLSWSHYRTLLQVENESARAWYEKEAMSQVWSVRTLQRNISSQYYFRLLQSPAKEDVRREMLQLTTPLQDSKEYLKNPVVAEFLGFHNNTSYSESDLEQSILNHLPQFLMEMGKGFAFVDRQKHIHTEKRDYYIDLVFYNYLLKCFVLIDLKTNVVDYQDAGQMDMYIKMYDEKFRSEGDNPTIGVILCADTDEDVARYSSLHDNEHLYMAKYLTYMPTQEDLRREIEQQKALFQLQHTNK